MFLFSILSDIGLHCICLPNLMLYLGISMTHSFSLLWQGCDIFRQTRILTLSINKGHTEGNLECVKMAKR